MRERTGYEDREAARAARKLKAAVIGGIDALHRAWLLDSEISERLGLEPSGVWHARQIHGINRHK